jgi:hypothetical protein
MLSWYCLQIFIIIIIIAAVVVVVNVWFPKCVRLIEFY